MMVIKIVAKIYINFNCFTKTLAGFPFFKTFNNESNLL